jgi:transposase
MSTGKRHVFGREFKLSAVKRMLAGERVATLSRELQIPAGHLYKWCRQFRRGGPDALRPACSSRSRRCVISRSTGREWRAINGNGRDPCAWLIPKGEG